MNQEQADADRPNLRQQAEAIIAGEVLDLEDFSPLQFKELVHELRVHQIELELQNEELRRTQFERELALDRYDALFQSAPVGYALLDEDGVIVQTSQTTDRLLERPASGLKGQRLSHFVLPADQDRYHFFLQKLSSSDETQRVKLSLGLPDDLIRYILLEGRRDSGGLVAVGYFPEDVRYHLSLSDITALTETEQAYQTLVESSLQGLAVIQNGQIVFANPALAALIGYSLEEIRGWSFEEMINLVHPADRPAVADNITQRDVTPYLEVRYRHKNGELRWLESQASPVEYLGKPALLVIYRDTTERKEIALALRESQERFRKIYDNALVGIAISDENGQFVQCNPAYCNFVGYTEAELRQMNFLSLVHPEDRAANWAEHERLLAGEQTYIEIRNRYIHKDGHSLWARKFVSILTGVAGEPLYDMAVVVDISARVATEQALSESEARLNGIIHTATDAIITTDAGQRIILFNAAAEQMTGYTVDQVRGQPLSLLLPERARAAHSSYVDDFAKTGLSSRSLSELGDMYGLRADGTEFPIEVMISQVEVGGQRYFTAIMRDISEQKELEQVRARLLTEVVDQREQLRLLAEKLTNAQEAERKALARELHDQVGQQLTSLNLTLTTLRAHILAPGHDPAPQALMLADRSLALVEETINRIQDVMANLRPSVLDDYGLLAALNWYVARLAPQLDFAIEVGGTEPDPRPPAAVELALFRIAQEALNNAIKHSRAKTVTIELEANSLLRLTISDDGVGFVVENQQLPGRWAGLGLLTISERAEAVGGVCHIESQPGGGTRIIAEVDR